MTADTLETITELPHLSPRAPDSHKGSYGRVLVVAGSRGMSGAAILSGSAALRGGAGLVRVAAPHEIVPIVAAGNPCYTTMPLPQDGQGRVLAIALNELLPEAKSADVLALGPGLGRSPDVLALLAGLLERSGKPAVIDADALNAFAAAPQRLRPGEGVPRVLTPHPAEFARLLHIDARAVQADRRNLAARFAREHGVVVLLKGLGTIVTDGRRVSVNTTGNPGMATGGTGDVLTGLIAALLGQGLPAFEAAQLGAHLHGLAGDLARDQLGEASLIASDLLAYLPAAFRHRGAAVAG